MNARILGEVARIAAAELDHQGPVDPDARLVEDLGLDSIRLLTLATAVEDHFRICLDEDDEDALITVRDLVATIEAKVDGRHDA